MNVDATSSDSDLLTHEKTLFRSDCVDIEEAERRRKDRYAEPQVVLMMGDGQQNGLDLGSKVVEVPSEDAVLCVHEEEV